MLYDLNGNQVTTDTESSDRRKKPYFIYYLDCGRMYYSKSNILAIIDAMYTNGLNQLGLHFSEVNGFRFALDDMSMVCDGIEYDLSEFVSDQHLTQTEMDEIIEYANSRKIDVMPCLDMPGHMGVICSAFPQFSYNTNNPWAINVKSESACNFAKAIAKKFATYFALKGCKWWCIGADEVGVTDTESGRWRYSAQDATYFVNFINSVAEMVTDMGFIPRAFNDGCWYALNSKNAFNSNIEILHWATGELQGGDDIMDASFLAKKGYTLINTSYYFYDILNSIDYSSNMITDTLFTNFLGSTLADNQAGVCLAAWSPTTGTDGGDGFMTEIKNSIANFGKGIIKSCQTLDYPIV